MGAAKGNWWRLKNSLWIILGFVMFLNWTAFIYIGVKAKSRRWFILGWVYFAFVALPFFKTSDFFVSIYLLSWMICLVHAFVVKGKFLNKLEQLNDPSEHKKPEIDAAKAEEINPFAAEAVMISDGFQKVQELKKLSEQIKEQKLKAKLTGIISQGNKILRELEQSPVEVRKAKQFLNYYLDTTLNIVTKYIKLNSQQAANEEFIHVLNQFDKALDSIKIAFEKQMEMLLEDDLFDLAADISVLDKLVKSDVNSH